MTLKNLNIKTFKASKKLIFFVLLFCFVPWGFSYAATAIQNHAPIVYAGTDKVIMDNQSILMTATARDPDGDYMTYYWTCSGGTLSRNGILNPVYIAPSVFYDTNFTCTLTVTDSHGLFVSDSVNILVKTTSVPANYSNIYAGSTIYLSSGQSVIIHATSPYSSNSNVYYSWTCSGGTLSSYNVLNPIYYAPNISYNVTYVCTITAIASNGISSKSSVDIVINGSNLTGLSVSLSANPSSGNAPLNNVSLTADTTANTTSVLITYRFDCENNNSWDKVYESYNTSYTAYNICNYSYSGNHTAKVRVEGGGYIAEDTTNIYVSGAYNFITVNADTDKVVNQGQSIILNGYAYGQSGSSLTYYWTCSGGTLSNSNYFSPTYYAPYVSYDTVYTCTLYANDGRGNSNSDSVNITVRALGTSGNLSTKTNNAENISTNSARLKGMLVGDGGQSVAVRFDWGRTTSYTNYTDWDYNQSSGSVFFANISGLEKGKVYHYRTEISSGRDSATGQDVAFITKPDSPTNFSATTLSSSEIQLNWNKGEGSCYTKVVRKKNSYPTNALDGAAVYYDSDNNYIDKNLSPGTIYYYRAWSVACDEGKYSFSDSLDSKDSALTSGQPAATAPENNSIILETSARNLSQNEKDWNDHISAASGEEIEFNIIVSADGNRPLTNVVVKNIMPKRMGCIYDAEIDGKEYDGSLETVNLGTVSLNQSKVISFKGLIDSEAGDNCRDKKINVLYGSDELSLSSKVSAINIDTVSSTLRIGIGTAMGLTAGVGQLLDSKVSVSSLILLMLFLIFAMMVYQVFERRAEREKMQKRGAGAFRSPTSNIK